MKTFKQFQEQIKTGGTIKKPTVIMPDGKELPGLGGGGGGTNAITAKAKTKTFKNRVKDVGKILTFPISRRNIKPDPTEKFATESVGALRRGGSALIPALMTGIGAAGTMMQARKKGKRKLSAAEKKLFDKSQRDTDQRDDVIKSNPTEIDKQNKLIDRYSKRYKTPKQKTDTQKFLKGLARGEIIQDEFSAPTNNVGGGQIAGTVEAGDNPPVKRKKKTYAYGGRGSRKMWMNNK